MQPLERPSVVDETTGEVVEEFRMNLDEARRTALFDEITALDLQAFMTGTERDLFAGLEGRAQFVRVAGGALETD